MEERMEARVSGRVQLVMFRDYVKRHARRLGLFGFVRNETDGTVVVVAEGSRTNLDRLITDIKVGSLFSRVDRVDVEWRPAIGEFESFMIRRN